MTIHEQYMMRCFELAQLGAGRVSPNPMVGCVIVLNDAIIGEGWHQSYGGPHAEVNAVDNVKDKSLLTEATLYVNLEPCSIFGNTPPCADLIIKSNIPKVVLATIDDNPEVSGNGIKKMREHGIEVTTGILQEEARELNKHFITYQTKKRPYVFLKWAQSRDGYFAPDDGQHWLSNSASKRLTHRFRHDMDAILVGRKTAMTDNPKLTDRYWMGRSPLRVILDPKKTLTDNLKIFHDDIPVLVLNADRAGKTMPNQKAEFVSMGTDEFHPEDILTTLYDRKIMSVMIEGGADTLNRFIKAGLWDEAVVYVSAQQLSSGLRAPNPGSSPSELVDLDTNQVEVYYP